MKTGIWQSSLVNSLIDERFQLSLGEGNTPFVKIANVYFKQEYLNPTGSIKDRGMAFQISNLYQINCKTAVIASSGNAAISAVRYADLAGIKVICFLPKNADLTKVQELRHLGADVKLIEDSVKRAGIFAQDNNYAFIRPSINDDGDLGYMSLGEELSNIEAGFEWLVFPVSSGTTLVGCYKGLEKLGVKFPKLLVVQTSNINSIACEYDPEFRPESKSLATGIVSKVTPRKNQVHNLIKLSQGDACVVDNMQIQQAYNELHKMNFDVSYDSAVSWAGWKKYNEKLNIDQNVCIVLTGKKR